MSSTRYVLALAAATLLAACAGSERLESSRGVALRINDDVDALETAMDRAQDHCDEHDRFAVLQSVSQVDNDQLLATFDCVESRGGGVALVVDDGDDDLRATTRDADEYCDDFDRIAVLQSVGEIDNRRVATFNCVKS